MDTFGTNLVWIIAALVDLAIKIAALIIIPRRRKPTAAMAWLLAIFLIPYVGIILFLLIGSFTLPKKRRDQQAAINALITDRVAGRSEPAEASGWPVWFRRVVEQNLTLTSLPALG